MTNEEQRAYSDGLRDGQINSLKGRVDDHAERIGDHAKRLALLERICWVMFGVVATIQFVPEAREILNALLGSG